MVSDIDLYSDFIEDLLTMLCFLSFQDTKDEPKNVQYPLRERLKLHLPQFAYENPCNYREVWIG